jgi:ketosteroid isomerase-like protein
MNKNEVLIDTFYNAFQSKDYETMQKCYSDDATFNDPVFKNLDATETRAMWEMFCKNGKELEITYKNIISEGEIGLAEWTATYVFSKTGRKVTNHIRAEFTILDGKIISHTDSFNLYKWSAQALGLPGLLLGWTPIIRNKIRATAQQSLKAFMLRNSGKK